MTFEDLVARCKCSVTLTVNEYRDHYLEKGEHLRSFIDIDKEERKRLRAGKDLYELQFYPDTPVGAHFVFGVSMEDVLQQAAVILEKT